MLQKAVYTFYTFYTAYTVYTFYMFHTFAALARVTTRPAPHKATTCITSRALTSLTSTA